MIIMELLKNGNPLLFKMNGEKLFYTNNYGRKTGEWKSQT